MNDPTDPYADIRPYRDDEVARVLQGLRDEPGLINTQAEWKLGPLYRFAPTLARALAKTWLGHRHFSSTAIYTRLTNEATVEATAAINQLMDALP